MKMSCICADIQATLEISTSKLIANDFITISSMIQPDSLLCSQWSRSNMLQNSLTGHLREDPCMGEMTSQNQPSGTGDPGFMENRLFSDHSRCQDLSEIWSAQPAQTYFLILSAHEAQLGVFHILSQLNFLHVWISINNLLCKVVCCWRHVI